MHESHGLPELVKNSRREAYEYAVSSELEQRAAIYPRLRLVVDAVVALAVVVGAVVRFALELSQLLALVRYATLPVPQGPVLRDDFCCL